MIYGINEIKELTNIYAKKLKLPNEIEEIKELKQDFINGQVISNKSIGISSRLYQMCINKEPNYEVTLKRIIGHELIHIKYNDNKYRHKSDLYNIYALILRYLSKHVRENDYTNKMILALIELRADIEGKNLLELTNEEYKAAWDEELTTREKFKIEKAFFNGYPSDDIRENAYKYNQFNGDIVEKMLKKYMENFLINDKRVKDYFGFN